MRKTTGRKTKSRKPRILVVTPEITYLPQGMGNMADRLTAKAGGLADVSASLVAALFELGADVHVALPNFRRIFHIEVAQLINEELRVYKSILPDSRIHLAEDRSFYYRSEVYSSNEHENPVMPLAFQREVINNIVPTVKPHLIHCNDWMTGLIPAMSRRMDIPCLFTLHNIHTIKTPMSIIEDRGIDAAEFWPYLFFSWPPYNYEESRNTNPVDFLASGIFASHFINTVSPTFLEEVCKGYHNFIPGNIRHEMAQKKNSDCAMGILNSPDPSYSPEVDTHIFVQYDHSTHVEGKKANKALFQKKTGLIVDPDAALFFWPSRLDPVQKGCQLMTDILYHVCAKYGKKIQIAVVANGPYQHWFHEIQRIHNLYGQVAVYNFNESLSRLGYAASDFMLMPSLFEPCGLPQMISAIYGSLPVAHDTGGIHDTVEHLSADGERGNGFLFKNYDSGGLFWAIGEAMQFFNIEKERRSQVITRVMRDSIATFNHKNTASKYIELYERMLNRPLINPY